jgi:hypothetical protein
VPTDRPLAVDGLDVNEVNDGLVVYDPGRDRVHYLNATAAVIFVLCDGVRDAAAIAAKAAAIFGAGGGPSPAEVETCLRQLRDEGILRSDA